MNKDEYISTALYWATYQYSVSAVTADGRKAMRFTSFRTRRRQRNNNNILAAAGKAGLIYSVRDNFRDVPAACYINQTAVTTK